MLFSTPDAWLARKGTRPLKFLDHGSLEVTTPRGRVLNFRGKHPGIAANLQLADWQMVRQTFLRGDIGFCEGYIEGTWTTRDLPQFFIFALENMRAMGGFFDGAWWQRAWFTLNNTILRGNTRSGSRANIMAHYDLGNDFYKLWLDETMTYSSALYEGEEGRSLAEAQRAKYRRILGHLNLAPGNKVLEIGCGWGGFAEEALRAGQSSVGLTLSPSQRAWAMERLRPQETDATKADIRLQDYRDVEGQFDGIVSIEMLEAVGERYWPQYFSGINRLLKPKGRAVIQVITILDEEFARYRRSGDFIRQYVFPGGMLISPSRFREEAAKAGLRVVEDFSFGQDYARTLRAWLERFDAAEAEIRAQGFDDAFLRLWRLYLSMCIGSFTVGRTDVVQYTLEHA